MKVKLFKYFSYFFTPLAIVFILYFAWKNQDSLSYLFKQITFSHLFFSMALCIATHFLIALASFSNLRVCDKHLSYIFVLKSYIKNIPARYVPGGIWHTATRAIDFHQQGVPNKAITVVFLLENIFALGVAFFLGGLGIFLLQKVDFAWITLAFIASLGSLFLFLVSPLALQLIFNVRLKLSFYFFSFLTFLVIWFLFSSSFLVYFLSFSVLNTDTSAWDVIFGYLFSWGIGYLAFFAPQGIGVFEVTLANLLDSALPISSLIVIIAGFRIIIFLADITLWGFSKLGRLI